MIKFSLLAVLVLVVAVPCHAKAGDREPKLYELKRGNFTLKFTNWGATMVSCILPDKNGNLDDIILGYESLDSYKKDKTYFGAIVGRVANRIGGAEFKLNGTDYKLPPNDGGNTLHGGPKGFSDVLWNMEAHVKDRYITFTYNSFDGEEGFPGDVKISVTYMFIGSNKLGIKMLAKPLNKPTPVNLAFHVYWNLAGHDKGTILNHTLQLFASKVTPVSSQLIPSGVIASVVGSSYDFLKPRTIESRFEQVPRGYDINYVLDDAGVKHLRRVAKVEESSSGRKMELWTNQPGVQFYTGNMIKDQAGGKGGVVYHQYGGLALETQGFPDSVNHPNFPSQIVNPGETYEHTMVYRFVAE